MAEIPQKKSVGKKTEEISKIITKDVSEKCAGILEEILKELPKKM